MAGRRGIVRGGRLNDDSGRGRGQREGGGEEFASSTGRGVPEECDEGFGLGFAVSSEEGGNWDCGGGHQASASEAWGVGAIPDSCGPRRTLLDGAIDPSGTRGAQIERGRGGRAASAAQGRGRGGRAGVGRNGGVGGSCSAGRGGGLAASLSGPRDSSAGGGRNSAAGGQLGASSTAVSTQDDATDEVPEGHAQQREKALKGKNFKPDEERQLARSVLRISQDAVVGNGQKGSAFWDRICKHYNERRPFQFRPMRSLETKWGSIKHDVSKYIAVLQQCTNLNASGANAVDLQKKALELYALKSAKNDEFTYLHVWDIVKDVPRWNGGCTQEKATTPIMKRKDAPSQSENTGLPPSSSTDGGGGSASPRGRLRPHGSKRAKEERRLTSLEESAAKAQALATQAMADATLKKTQVIEDQNVFMLMTHVRDAVLSDTQARYLKLRQEQELKKLEALLAADSAGKTTVHPCPPPIPVETPEVLQRRVAEALAKTRSNCPEREAQVSDAAAKGVAPPMQRMEESRRASFANLNDAVVHGVTYASPGGNRDDFNDRDDEVQYDYEPLYSRQGGLDMNTGDLYCARENAWTDQRGHFDSEHTEEEDQDDTFAAGNRYSKQRVQVDDFEESQDCNSIGSGTFDLNAALYLP